MVDAASLFNGLPVGVRQEIAASSDKQSALINALISNHEQAMQKLEADNLSLRRKIAALSVEVSSLRGSSHRKTKAIQIYPIDLTGSESEQSTLASCKDGSDHSEARADCMSPPATSVAGKRKHALGSSDISPAGSPEAKKARQGPESARSAVATGEPSLASSSVPVDPDRLKNKHNAEVMNGGTTKPSTAHGMDERGGKPPIPIQAPEPIPLSPKSRAAPPRAEGSDPGPLGSAPVKNAGRVKPLDFSVLQEALNTKEPPARMEENSATKVSATLAEREAGLRVAIKEARVAQLTLAMSKAMAPRAVVSPPASAPNRSNAVVRTPPQTVPKQTSTAGKGQKMVTWFARRGAADAGPAQSPRAVGSFVLTSAAKLPTSSTAALMSQPRGVPPPARAPTQPSLDVPTAGADRP